MSERLLSPVTNELRSGYNLFDPIQKYKRYPRQFLVDDVKRCTVPTVAKLIYTSIIDVFNENVKHASIYIICIIKRGIVFLIISL